MDVDDNTTRNKYLHGNFDKDGVPNIDDKYPFRKARKGEKSHRINPELSLSEELQELERVERETRKKEKPFREEVGGDFSRTKHHVSILRKLRKKHLSDLTDTVGTTIVVPNREAVHAKARELHRRYGKRVSEDENFYTEKRSDGYRARHLIIRQDDGMGYEVKIISKPMLNISERSHYAYKRGDKAALALFKREFDEAARRGY